MWPSACVLAALLAGACVGPGLLTDGSSVSLGTHGRGALRGGVALPPRGEGFVVPPRWRDRRRSFGTDELAQLIVHTARQVRRAHPRTVLGVGDLSPRGGGPTPEHLSHHSGRDVDLFLYGTTLDGTPVEPVEMTSYDSAGRSQPPPQPTGASDAGVTSGNPPQPQRLDIAAMWTMIKTLVTHPDVQVQWVFIGRPIARLLLAHARRIREPQWLVERAVAVLHQPSDAQSHMDHLHVRIFCPPSDRPLGCIDRGPPRWLKKSIDYAYVARQRLPLAFAPLRSLPWGRCPLARLVAR